MVPWGILVLINVPEPIERQSFRSADACEIQDLTPVAARVTPPRGGRGTGDGANPRATMGNAAMPNAHRNTQVDNSTFVHVHVHVHAK